MPCGPLKLVEKHECVNQVTKQMGSALRRLLREYKGKRLNDEKSLGDAGGGLTILRCDSIQSFYGKCIRENKGNVDKMSKEIKAIFYHYSSTADFPRHDHCPDGDSSWCSYKRDIVKNQNP